MHSNNSLPMQRQLSTFRTHFLLKSVKTEVWSHGENFDKTAVFISFCILAAVVFVITAYRKSTRKSYQFPPGPKGLPFLGSVFNISLTEAQVEFAALTKQYGDVITLTIAGNKTVVLNSADAIREAFVTEETRDAFAGRPDSFYVRYCDRGPSTAFMDYGNVWRLQRQFLIKSLKIFEDENTYIENIIREELEIVAETIKCTKEEPFYITNILTPSLVNILLALIAGKRCVFDHHAVQRAIEFENVNSRIQAGQAMVVLTALPFLRFLPFGYGKLYQKQQRCLENVLHHVYELPKQTFDPSVTRGFIDDLFRLQLDNHWLKDDNIRGIVRESIAAGLTTTRSALRDFFLIILHKPEVMVKIQDEIDSVIGRDRYPRIADKNNLPYTEAATLELHRYVTVSPLGVPRSTTRDVAFRGYTLPKETLVLSNLWAAHHDEKVWGDPWIYRPERFLDDRGKLLPADHKMRRNWLAFGVGRRSCLAETFARSGIFLVITTLLQQFDFRPCVDVPLPSYDPRGYEKGITLHAPPFKLRAVPRQL